MYHASRYLIYQILERKDVILSRDLKVLEILADVHDALDLVVLLRYYNALWTRWFS